MASLADFTKPYDREDVYGPAWLKSETICECPPVMQQPRYRIEGSFSMLRCDACGCVVTHDRTNRKEPGSYETRQ